MAEKPMPLWGWGDPDHERDLPAAASGQLAERFPGALERRVPVEMSEFTVPEGGMSSAARTLVSGSLPDGRVSADVPARLLKAAGKSYPDLVRMRAGRPDQVPDIVVSPTDPDEVEAVIAACRSAGSAVIPFGGGTSVTGGLSAMTGGHDGAVSLDLSGLNGLVSLDEESRIGTFLAGTTGPEVEAALAGSGLTLGHFPQSFEYATVGGFVATRSSGQASTGYGRIESNLLGAELVSPSGRLRLDPMPGTAAGPELRRLVAGSEGTLGVITSVDLQLAAAPRASRDSAWVVRGFDHGQAALRALEQAGCAPSVARLSDEDETALTLLLASGSRAGRLFAGVTNLRGRDNPCLLIACYEGTEGNVARREADGVAILRSVGARRLGRAPARAWRKGRFSGPYLRDVLMGHGLMVDTLETATTWSGLGSLYASVRRALNERLGAIGGEPIVMCHVSHLYRGGASLYFTFVGMHAESDPEGMIEEWMGVKRAAGDAIKAAGGTITHHHAIGIDHREWMPAEVGELGIRALRAIKSELDPSGIMNPGKLLPDRP